MKDKIKIFLFIGQIILLVLVVFCSVGCSEPGGDNTTPNTYSVNYNGNGYTEGSIPVDSNSYATGVTVTVLSNTGNLGRICCTFVRWNTEENGSGEYYTAGNTFNIGNADVTLYAQWTLDIVI